MEEVEFKLATMDDLKSISAIYEHIHEAFMTTINYPKWPKGLYPTEESAYEAIDNQEMYIYKINGMVVGSVILNHQQDSGYENAQWQIQARDEQVLVIHTLAIDPLYQHKGYASQMLKWIKKQAILKGCLALRLDITENNLPARYLYQKNGFYFTGITSLHREESGIRYSEMFEYNIQKPSDQLELLVSVIDDFVTQRDWHQYHSADNLSKSIIIEAAELLECFQWDDEHDIVHVCEELADVMIYSIQLAIYLHVDIKEIILDKMIKNAQKYPVNKKVTV